MRALGVVGLVLCLAACGGSKHAQGSITVSSGTSNGAAIPSTRVILHAGETRVVLTRGQKRTLHVACLSHGVLLKAPVVLARGAPGVEVGRDIWKRGIGGTASLSISTARKTVRLTCS